MMDVQTLPQPVRLRFSVDEYYKLIELGILKIHEKSEIIEGELINKSPIGEWHASVVNFLSNFFKKNISKQIRVGIQNPLRLSDFDQPEPDIVLSDLRKYDGKRHPRPKEVLLIIEVSDTTLKYDRDIKLPLYAEAGIAEVWIINLKKDIIEVHQKPFNDIYQTVKVFKSGETVKSKILPDLNLEVDKILA